ncbi:ABC transporter ATP-binding protein [Azorhizobium doebereinerae]|uniref:ABC transporter ATP-binding protein n=1 Tax=Azorhizobium doebereinerae TaxID=281091 RepID=UPI00040D82C2|nr:ABC transporter ATP-binding protein [Azorhizobium doebereinerae]
MMLEVRDLAIDIARPDAEPLRLVNDVSFRLAAGRTLGIVGESGSGKSMLLKALIGLLPGTIRATGSILFDGTDLLALGEAEMCRVRGRRIGMIFQEPMTALNPAQRIGDQIAEGIRWHRRVSAAEARAEALQWLERVRIPDARRRIDTYPHEMSGGQRQRVGIAIALAMRPDLLIADEPTTALDVTVQAEILDIFDELVSDLGVGLILVSHDLGVIGRIADETLVLYAGTRMEEGPTEAVLRHPRHPYTRGLLAAMPRRGGGVGAGGDLPTIPGTVPSLAALPPGCRFANRCGCVTEACRAAEPAWRTAADGRGLRCILGPEAAA